MTRTVYTQQQMTEFLIRHRQQQNKIDAYKRAGWMRNNEQDLQADYDMCGSYQNSEYGE